MTPPNVQTSDKELEDLVTDMVKAGVSDDEIKKFIRDYSPAFAQSSTPVSDDLPKQYKVTTEDYLSAAKEMPGNVVEMVGGAVAGIPDAAKTLGYIATNLPEAAGHIYEGGKEAIKSVVLDEAGDFRGLGDIVSGVGRLALEFGVSLPGVNEIMGATGATEELGMTPEMHGRNFTFNLLTLGLGKYVGGKIASGTLDKVGKAAGLTDEAVMEMSSLDHATKYLADLTPEELIGVAKEAAVGYKSLPAVGKDLAVGGASGVVGGLGMTDDPEQNLRGLFASGVTGALLQAGLTKLGGGYKAQKQGILNAEGVSKELLRSKSMDAVKQLEPEASFKTSLDIWNGVPIVEAIQKNMPDHSALIVHEIPKKSLVKDVPVYITKQKGEESRYSALIAKGIDISDEWKSSFERTGMVPSQIVAYKGKEYSFVGKEPGKYHLKSLETGEIVTAKRKSDITVPDKFEIVDDGKPLDDPSHKPVDGSSSLDGIVSTTPPPIPFSVDNPPGVIKPTQASRLHGIKFGAIGEPTQVNAALIDLYRKNLTMISDGQYDIKTMNEMMDNINTNGQQLSDRVRTILFAEQYLTAKSYEVQKFWLNELKIAWNRNRYNVNYILQRQNKPESQPTLEGKVFAEHPGTKVIVMKLSQLIGQNGLLTNFIENQAQLFKRLNNVNEDQASSVARALKTSQIAGQGDIYNHTAMMHIMPATVVNNYDAPWFRLGATNLASPDGYVYIPYSDFNNIHTVPDAELRHYRVLKANADNTGRGHELTPELLKDLKPADLITYIGRQPQLEKSNAISVFLEKYFDNHLRFLNLDNYTGFVSADVKYSEALRAMAAELVSDVYHETIHMLSWEHDQNFIYYDEVLPRTLLANLHQTPTLAKYIEELAETLFKVYENQEYKDLTLTALSQKANVPQSSGGAFASKSEPPKFPIDRRVTLGARQDVSSVLNKIRKDLSPEDQTIIANNEAALKRISDATGEDIASKAARSGHYFRQMEGGRVGIYNLADDIRDIKFFDNLESAKEYLDGIGVKVGETTLSYDGPGSITPSEVMASGWVDPDPYQPKLPGMLERKNAELTQNIRYFMQYREFFTAMETLNPTPLKGLYAETYGDVRDAWLHFNAARHPHTLRIKNLHEQFKDLTPEERSIVPQYIETMTPDEVKAKLLVNRPLSPFEIQYGEQIASILGSTTKNLGIANVFAYLRAQEALLTNKQFQGVKGKALEKVIADMKLSEPELQVAELFSEIKGKGLSDAALYPITRLANAIMLDTPNRADFAKINKMSPKQIAFAHAVENWFKDMGEEFGIRKEQLLNGYITHIKNYDPQLAAQRWGSGDLNEEFFASLVRTGENGDLVKDPFELMLRYVNSGYRTKLLNPIINKARADFAEFSNNLRESGMPEAIKAADQLQKYGEDFLYKVQAGSDGTDALVYNTLQTIADKVNPGAPNRNFTFVDTLLKTIELNAQGFKLVAGLRDGTSVIQSYLFRFGPSRTGKMMSLMGKAHDTVDILRLMGEIPGLERLKDIIPEEADLDILRRNKAKYYAFVDKVSDVAFKLSGQPLVYNYMQAATWHEVGQNSIKAIRKFNESVRENGNSVTDKMKKVLVKDLDLDSYSTPVYNYVMEAILKGNTDKAVNTLRRTSMEEVIGLYGSINSPPVLGSKLGKVAFQFGQWPMWWINSWRRLVTHGSNVRKLKALGYMTAAATIWDLVQEETGFNLESWKMTHILPAPFSSLDFRGSPVAGMTSTAIRTGMATADMIREGTMDILPGQFQDQADSRATTSAMNMLNPLYPALAPYPKPLMLYNLLEGMQRLSDGDPAYIGIGKMLGMPINTDQHPAPWGENILDY